jgi:hypothetical protein
MGLGRKPGASFDEFSDCAPRFAPFNPAGSSSHRFARFRGKPVPLGPFWRCACGGRITAARNKFRSATNASERHAVSWLDTARGLTPEPRAHPLRACRISRSWLGVRGVTANEIATSGM